MAPLMTLRRRLRSEAGSELIEVALTMPLVLLLVLGLVEFGFVFQEYEVVTNAAREGARIAVLPAYSSADATARVTQYLTAGGLVAARAVPAPTVSAPVAAPVGGAGTACISTVTVNVSYQHPVPFVGGISGYFGSSIPALTLHASSTMRTEAATVSCP